MSIDTFFHGGGANVLGSKRPETAFETFTGEFSGDFASCKVYGGFNSEKSPGGPPQVSFIETSFRLVLWRLRPM